ncbi:hypothetical protein BV20DRAFT_74928 [Pilatotrama ljubarskyi]|nr:hypothetical protein BV20DRAFT_74928 [Pilatotrama ljubarskyi]
MLTSGTRHPARGGCSLVQGPVAIGPAGAGGSSRLRWKVGLSRSSCVLIAHAFSSSSKFLLPETPLKSMFSHHGHSHNALRALCRTYERGRGLPRPPGPCALHISMCRRTSAPCGESRIPGSGRGGCYQITRPFHSAQADTAESTCQPSATAVHSQASCCTRQRPMDRGRIGSALAARRSQSIAGERRFNLTGQRPSASRGEQYCISDRRPGPQRPPAAVLESAIATAVREGQMAGIASLRGRSERSTRI